MQTPQTKQARHTPLPWQYAGSFNGQNLTILSERFDGTLAMNGGDGHVATIPTKEYGIDIKGTEAEANAKLITKAVNSHEELLGALQNVIYLLKAHAGKSWNIDDAVAEAEKAIAHATGE